MSETLDIERIVHEVVRRLRHAGIAGTRVGRSMAMPTESADVLRLSEKVVTLSQLANKLEGKKKLIVTSRAVVTPSAHDELRAQGIALVRNDEKVRSAPSRLLSNIRLMIATEDNNYHSGKWASPQFVRSEYAAARGSLAQLNEIEASLARSDYRTPVGICVTSNPYLVACAANRRTAIRAAAVHDLDGVREVQRTLKANLFVVKSDVDFYLHELIDALIL